MISRFNTLTADFFCCTMALIMSDDCWFFLPHHDTHIEWPMICLMRHRTHFEWELILSCAMSRILSDSWLFSCTMSLYILWETDDFSNAPWQSWHSIWVTADFYHAPYPSIWVTADSSPEPRYSYWVTLGKRPHFKALCLSHILHFICILHKNMIA